MGIDDDPLAVDAGVVRTLGRGDFFGELAPLRLLVVPHHVFQTVAALPPLRDRIRGAVRVRLPES